MNYVLPYITILVKSSMLHKWHWWVKIRSKSFNKKIFIHSKSSMIFLFLHKTGLQHQNIFWFLCSSTRWHLNGYCDVMIKLCTTDDVIMIWKCVLHYFPFVRGIHQSPMVSLTQKINAALNVTFVVSIKKQMNKQLSWYAMLRHDDVYSLTSSL